MKTHSLMMSGLKNIKTHKIFDIEYNDTQIYLGFLFNIYTKLKYEDETFKNTTTVKRIVGKLGYI